MNMNDLKSGEPFFDDWYIDSYIGTTQSGAAFKIYREQDGLHEFNIMKVIEIPRDKCVLAEESKVKKSAQYYKELVTEVYRKICLLENIPERQHIVSYEDHLIYQLDNQPSYEVLVRMEFLGDYCENNNATLLTCQDVIHLGKNICEALDLCERYHIIHGEIRPDCIFLSEHGQYKLGDFSLLQIGSKLDDDESGNSLSISDHSDYIAPEIIAGERYDKRCDIYSLGLVLYTYLNNNMLPSDFMNKQLPMYGPKELGQVILKACEFRPEDRYQSAKEFQEALIAISVFLGDSLIEPINFNDPEDPEIFVAAAQEEKDNCDDVLQQELAHKQLQQELLQKLKCELSKEPIIEVKQSTRSEPIQGNSQSPTIQEKSRKSCNSSDIKEKSKKTYISSDIENKKEELRVAKVSLKRKRNMGPWILAVWTSVLTIAVLVLLIKSDFVFDYGEKAKEILVPVAEIQSTDELAQSDEKLLENETNLSITVKPDGPESKDKERLDEIEPTYEELPDDSDPRVTESSKQDPVSLLHSGEGLASFKGIQQIEEAEIIDFSDNSISDLTALSSASSVETLKLNHNMIADVRPLKKLITLKELDLSDNSIVTVVSLKDLKDLEVLSLSNNLLPNVLGVEKLTKLKMLYLDGNDIGDISKLSALKNLVYLNISNNRVGEEEILTLQSALPNCIINY